MQIIYHGSYCKIEKPKVLKDKFTKDFGVGFYCTILKEQAERWARKYDTKMVNVYEYQENNELKMKVFPTMTEEWLDFIINSRNGVSHDYDIVIGAMADDQVYNYITAYLDGKITRAAFWELAKFQHPTPRLAFCTEKSLDTIKFIEVEEL